MRAHWMAAVVLGCGLQAAVEANIVNLAPSANAVGMQPVGPAFGQGTINGINDGVSYNWLTSVGGTPSPRYLSGTGITNFQPYMTWATPVEIGSVRIWNDYEAPGGGGAQRFDRLVIDTLASGGNPAVEGDWINRVDTGTGLNKEFADLSLGGVFTTTGLRVRVFTAAPDIAVGEIAVFSSPTTLNSRRVFASSTASSSFQSPGGTSLNSSLVNDGDYSLNTPSTRWLSAGPGSNPGNDYTLDLIFAQPVPLSGAAVTFAQQGGRQRTAVHLVARCQHRLGLQRAAGHVQRHRQSAAVLHGLRADRWRDGAAAGRARDGRHASGGGDRVRSVRRAAGAGGRFRTGVRCAAGAAAASPGRRVFEDP
jgi:hypothetical protein